MMGLRIATISKTKLCNKLWIIAMYILYKVCLEAAYRFAISPRYFRMKLSWNPNDHSFALSVCFVIAIAATLPVLEGLSQNFLVLFDCISIIPAISFCWMTSENILYAFYITLFDCALHIILALGKRKTVHLVIGNEDGNRKVLMVLFVFYIFSNLLLIVYRGIDLRVLSFLQDKAIYEVRAQNNFSVLTGYLYNADEKLFFPFFLTVFLRERKRLGVILVMLLQIGLFLAYGYKLSLFSIAFVVGFYFFRANWKRFSVALLGMMSSIMLLMIITYNSSISLLNKVGTRMVEFLGMRTLFIPAYIKYRYFIFFENNPYLCFSEGQIGKILGLHSPYNKSIFLVISEWTNGAGGSWNTGIVSDAYANGGILGMVLIVIVAGFSLKMLDSVVAYHNSQMAFASVAIYAVYMNDNGMLTTLMTNGFFLMIIMLGLYECTTKKNMIKMNYKVVFRRSAFAKE